MSVSVLPTSNTVSEEVGYKMLAGSGLGQGALESGSGSTTSISCHEISLLKA